MEWTLPTEPRYLIAVYAGVGSSLLLLLFGLLYVFCSRRYRLNWWERSLLEQHKSRQPGLTHPADKGYLAARATATASVSHRDTDDDSGRGRHHASAAGAGGGGGGGRGEAGGGGGGGGQGGRGGVADSVGTVAGQKGRSVVRICCSSRRRLGSDDSSDDDDEEETEEVTVSHSGVAVTVSPPNGYGYGYGDDNTTATSAAATTTTTTTGPPQHCSEGGKSNSSNSSSSYYYHYYQQPYQNYSDNFCYDADPDTPDYVKQYRSVSVHSAPPDPRYHADSSSHGGYGHSSGPPPSFPHAAPYYSPHASNQSQQRSASVVLEKDFGSLEAFRKHHQTSVSESVLPSKSSAHPYPHLHPYPYPSAPSSSSSSAAAASAQRSGRQKRSSSPGSSKELLCSSEAKQGRKESYHSCGSVGSSLAVPFATLKVPVAVCVPHDKASGIQPQAPTQAHPTAHQASSPYVSKSTP